MGIENFEGYGVEITLHSLDTYRGYVTQIVDKEVTLSNAEHINTKQKINHIVIKGDMINDLSVFEVPKEALVRNKKNKKTKQIDQNVEETLRKESNEASIVEKMEDDAIIFAKPKQKENEASRNKKKSNFNNNRKGSEETWIDDISQIKQSQDFDFESNLALFDKDSVFKDLKSKDTINYGDRLAGHNKVNYDIDEMVTTDTQDTWDDVGVSESKAIKPSVTQEKRKKVTVLKRPSSKSNISSAKQDTIKRQELTPKLLPQEAEYTPKAIDRTQVFSPVLKTDVKFELKNIGVKVTACTPLQLNEIERISNDKFGVLSEILTENASIGMLKLIIRILGGSSRLIDNHNKPPLVMVLAGNNRTGAKGIAAGRQLANRGARVIAFVFDHDDGEDNKSSNEDEYIPEVKHQLKLFNKYGGKIIKNFNFLQKTFDSLDSPLELVIDSFQGFENELLDFLSEDLKKCIEIIKLINHSRAKIVSIDIPSGLDGGSGQYSLTAGDVKHIKGLDLNLPEDLRVQSDVVVLVGLPVVGLVHAYNYGIADIGDWSHYMVDMGLPRGVFSSKAPLRKFNKVYFLDEWFSEMEVLPRD